MNENKLAIFGAVAATAVTLSACGGNVEVANQLLFPAGVDNSGANWLALDGQMQPMHVQDGDSIMPIYGFALILFPDSPIDFPIRLGQDLNTFNRFLEVHGYTRNDVAEPYEFAYADGSSYQAIRHRIQVADDIGRYTEVVIFTVPMDDGEQIVGFMYGDGAGTWEAPKQAFITGQFEGAAFFGMQG